jgi:hypothetical protein
MEVTCNMAYNYVDWSIRKKPYPFLKKALDIFKSINGQIIVEVGTMRVLPEHDINDYSNECCMEGHSSVVFAQNSNEFHTVDIDMPASRATYNFLKKLTLQNNWNVYNGDGIDFLKKFSSRIDLLFLDAWDIGTHQYAEKHLEAYLAAKDKLNDKHIILVDDTDINFTQEKGLHNDEESMGGKGSALIPYLLKDNYKVQFKGRQTCLTKNI